MVARCSDAEYYQPTESTAELELVSWALSVFGPKVTFSSPTIRNILPIGDFKTANVSVN